MYISLHKSLITRRLCGMNVASGGFQLQLLTGARVYSRIFWRAFRARPFAVR